MHVHSYNDAHGYLSNLDAFDEAYMRGANIWIRKPKTNGPDDPGVPRDCQRFFLREGVAENWSTLAANLARIPQGVKIGFRIIDMDHVPDGWPSIGLKRGTVTRQYPDFLDLMTRDLYERMLDGFKDDNPRITWVDIPYPFAPSNEPSINDDDCRVLGDWNGTASDEPRARALGRERYLHAAKWMIDTYVDVFGRAVVGNLGGPSWAAEILLPYALSKGVRAFRQDSFGHFDYGNGREGENRARQYDARIGFLGGRDTFDRLIFEITGNGLVAKTGGFFDQSGRGEEFPYEQMFGLGVSGKGPEYYDLLATDFGNMGLPAPWIRETQGAREALERWYDYIGQLSHPGPIEPPPGDGGDGGTVPAPYRFPVMIKGGEITRAVYDGPFPDIVFDPGTTQTTLMIPIVNGERWNPRVHILGHPGLTGEWAIDPDEPSGEDDAMSFHCAGRDYANVTFDGWEEPEPPQEWPKYVEHPHQLLTRFARIDKELVSLHTLAGSIMFGNSPDTAAFLRAVAQAIEDGNGA